MLFSKQCLILYLIALLSVFCGFFVLNQTKNFGYLFRNFNDEFLAHVAAIGFIFSMCRFVWSWSLDKKSFKFVFGALLGIQIFLSFTWCIVNRNAFIYALWVWLFTFAEGGIFVLMPNIINRTFGSKSTGIYGFFASFASASSLITLLMYKLFLHDTLASYNFFFIFNGLLSCAALAILHFLFEEVPYVPKS